MHHDFWHERWQTGQTGFHQSAVHPFLERWWPSLRAPAGARIYVPLCGKSLDMAWLADRGHTVVGSELSPIAIADFFASQGLAATKALAGKFSRHAAGPFEILEGDALLLTPDLTGPLDGVYDRAALVALPPDMRPAYAASLAGLLPSGARGLVVSFEYPQEMKGGPPFSVEAAEVRQLFGDSFSVHELERVDILAQSPKFAEFGIPALHEIAYALERQ
ncbi:MAG: thiopurine S-methyltransferase [Gammaproteobacteria bacterium]|nr:thiopurine S-methyltransferase [Gammaproteobacteria bacterium]